MKRTGIVLTLTLLLLAMAVHANATPQLRLGSVNALQGQTATLNLNLSGGEGAYAGINAKILLPEGVTFAGVSKGTLLLAGFTTDWHSVSNGVDNWATVIAYSGKDAFTSSSGTLLEIEVQLAPNAPIGRHSIQFSSSSSGLSNEDGSVSVTHTTSNGTINCVDPDGDSDGDGLSGSEELQLGTNPHNPDTDGDGLSDDCEANHETDPLLYDSDGDGYSDGYEVSANTNPVDENEIPVIYIDVENTSVTENGTEEYPFNTINEGIAAAYDKYTVLVASGTYEETVTISNDIRLIGQTPTTTIIDAGGDTQALHCDYDYDAGQVFSIEGFTIKNADNGINCADGSSPLIRNNIITGIDVCGIICGGSSKARIINNTISGNSNATAIQSSSSTITIVNNIISGNKAGIDCEGEGLRIDYNNLWSNTDGNYFNSTSPGVHDISGNPSFVDMTNDDFHLMSGSPCLDAGDAMEKLSGDYTGGDTLSVDEITNIAINDRIRITDGANVETDVVVAVTANTIRIQGQFANNYLIADGASIFTDTSDARQEPEPGNLRIDMGAQGNTSEAGAQEYHKGDINGDGDVDLLDAVLSLQVLTGIDSSTIVHKEADVNGDGKIGKEEVIYILQKFCRMR